MRADCRFVGKPDLGIFSLEGCRAYVFAPYLYEYKVVQRGRKLFGLE